jgi:hypothetical protein
MVSEHDKRCLEPGEKRAKACLSARVGHEVACQTYEVWLTRFDPADSFGCCPIATRQRSAEMEVGKVREPQPVKGCGKAPYLKVADPRA